MDSIDKKIDIMLKSLRKEWTVECRRSARRGNAVLEERPRKEA
jgi:hypothetical protein